MLQLQRNFEVPANAVLPVREPALTHLPAFAASTTIPGWLARVLRTAVAAEFEVAPSEKSAFPTKKSSPLRKIRAYLAWKSTHRPTLAVVHTRNVQRHIALGYWLGLPSTVSSGGRIACIFSESSN